MSDDQTPAEFYDAVAQEYGDANPPMRQYCRIPAVKSLLPDIYGKTILDAACGNGTDAAWLDQQGADVSGVDASEQMIETARQRFGDSVDFYHGVLGKTMPEFKEGEFDIIISQLTLSHIEDWLPVLEQFHHFLTSSGTLIVVVSHPISQFKLINSKTFPDISLYGTDTEPDVLSDNNEVNYFEITEYELGYGPDNSHTVSFYQRSISQTLQPFLDAGFRFERFLEPQFTEAFKDEQPEKYQSHLQRVPDLFCIKASMTNVL